MLPFIFIYVLQVCVLVRDAELVLCLAYSDGDEALVLCNMEYECASGLVLDDAREGTLLNSELYTDLFECQIYNSNTCWFSYGHAQNKREHLVTAPQHTQHNKYYHSQTSSSQLLQLCPSW